MPGDTTIHRSRTGDPTANTLIDRLVAAWEAGSPIPLGQLLPPEPAASMVADVACQEIALRLQAGQTVRVADYLAQYPQVAASNELVVYLLDAEVLGRKKHGPPPTLEEYVREFPQFRVELERHFVVSRPTLPDPPPGYVLTEKIGRGGMGVVYRARDLALKREVAVKVLLPRFAPTSDVARRFVEEAQITGQLQHPGVPAVHQVGALADGRPFLAMKLIKGRTLASLLADGTRLNAPAVFEGVCQAVGYAHTRGVIHRDLKPDNVMVGAFGEVQVMDWGLGKVLSDSLPPDAETVPDAPAPTPATAIHDPRTPDRQDTTGAAGTPWYMSPEQAAGEGEKVGPRTDVFGLGGILCALLTGKPPIDGTSAKAALTNAIRGETAAALARLAECGAEPGLVELCKRCLSADPADRPADAGEVAAAVAKLRSEAEERAKRAEAEKLEAAVREAEVKKRRMLARWATVAVMATLTVGAAVSLAFGLDARKKEEAVRDEKEKADNATTRAKTEKQAAIDARNELSLANTRTQRMFAKALLAPISLDYREIDVNERRSLVELSSLRQEEIGKVVIGEVISSSHGRDQLRARFDILSHVVTGLNSARRAEIDDLFRHHLDDPSAPLQDRCDLATILIEQGEDYVGSLLPAATLLLRTFASNESWDVRSRSALALGRWLLRSPVESEQVHQLSDRLLSEQHITRTERARGWESTELVLALSRMLPEHRCRPLLDQELRTLLTDLATASIDTKNSVGGRILMLLDRFPAGDRHLLAGAAVRACLELPADADVADQIVSAIILARFCAHLSPDEAADFCTPAARRQMKILETPTLVTRIKEATPLALRYHNFVGLMSLSRFLHPAERRDTYRRVLATASKTPWDESGSGRDMVDMLEVLAKACPPDDESSLTRIAELHLSKLDAGSGSSNKLERYSREQLMTSLLTVTAQLPASQRSGLIEQAVVAHLSSFAFPERNSDGSRFRLRSTFTYVGSRIQDMPVRLPPFNIFLSRLPAERVALFTAGPGWLPPGGRVERAALVGGVALPASLPPAVHARELIRLLTPINRGDGLAEGIALLARLVELVEPEEAVKLLSEAVTKLDQNWCDLTLLDALARACQRMSHPRSQAVRADVLGQILAKLEPTMNTEHIATLRPLLCEQTTTQHEHVIKLMALVGSSAMHSQHLQSQKPRPLPTQQLVELLKHPLCVYEARRGVLDALEFTYDRHFADLWEFVAFAEDHPELKLDLLTPPKRPAKK